MLPPPDTEYGYTEGFMKTWTNINFAHFERWMREHAKTFSTVNDESVYHYPDVLAYCQSYAKKVISCS